MISIVSSIDRNNGIGKDGQLLVKLTEDMKHFRALTYGHVVIMGRKTFESMNSKGLEGRCNIVLTRQSIRPFNVFKSRTVVFVKSMTTALKLYPGRKIFIIGGQRVFEEGIPYAREMYITCIDHVFDGADTFFPKEKSSRQWKAISTQSYDQDGLNFTINKFTTTKARKIPI